MRPQYKPVAPRLLANVQEFGDGCWEWTRSLDNHGYGQISFNGKPNKAYRVSYLIHVGPVAGLHVMHKCDNRKCINPSHLVTGSIQDNLADMRAKYRHVRGVMFPQAKLNEDLVREIRETPGTNKILGQLFGVNASVISRVKARKVWAHVN